MKTTNQNNQNRVLKTLSSIVETVNLTMEFAGSLIQETQSKKDVRNVVFNELDLCLQDASH